MSLGSQGWPPFIIGQSLAAAGTVVCSHTRVNFTAQIDLQSQEQFQVAQQGAVCKRGLSLERRTQ